MTNSASYDHDGGADESLPLRSRDELNIVGSRLPSLMLKVPHHPLLSDNPDVLLRFPGVICAKGQRPVIPQPRPTTAWEIGSKWFEAP